MQRRLQTRKHGVGEIELLDPKGGEVLARGSLRNVSEHGLGVTQLEATSDRTFTRGDELSVRLKIPQGPITTEARIQWVNAGQRALGLKMTPDKETATKLGRYLSNAPDSN